MIFRQTNVLYLCLTYKLQLLGYNRRLYAFIFSHSKSFRFCAITLIPCNVHSFYFLCCFSYFFLLYWFVFLHFQWWTSGFPSSKLLSVFSSSPLLSATVETLEPLHNLCSFTITFVHNLSFHNSKSFSLKNFSAPCLVVISISYWLSFLVPTNGTNYWVIKNNKARKIRTRLKKTF